MPDPDKTWTFWDALTNANPEWWDKDEEEEEEESDDEGDET